jgi:hypothetical protein
MFIIWGTKGRQEKLGTVADWCPNCQSARAFTVTKHFRVSHVYFIPLGRGTLVATVKQCWECSTQYHCEEETYDDFLPEKEVEEMPMSKLIRQTNTALKEWLDSRRQG